MKKIIPSIIARSEKELKERIKQVSFSKYLHLDVMDGKFVENKSFNFDFTLPTDKKYELHLMVEKPIKWLEKNSRKLRNVDKIFFHYESKDDFNKTIYFIKNKLNKNPGIALNPETSFKKIENSLKIRNILILTVNPGKYGSRFKGSVLKKVKEIKKKFPKIKIELDGGISEKTLLKSCKSGADSFVVGSYLQKSLNSKNDFNKLKRFTR